MESLLLSVSELLKIYLLYIGRITHGPVLVCCLPLQLIGAFVSIFFLALRDTQYTIAEHVLI